jgi:hypothetical protein
VTIFCNKPIDLGENKTMERFMQMVDEFESMKKSRGKVFSHLWVRDYSVFRMEDDLFETYDWLGMGQEESSTAVALPNPRPYYVEIKNFLRNYRYRHYRAFMQVDYSYDLPVRRFSFNVIYHNTSNWDERIELMQELRAVADRYADLDISVWEVNGMFVDQMLSLKRLTYFVSLFKRYSLISSL